MLSTGIIEVDFGSTLGDSLKVYLFEVGAGLPDEA
jgi:hypothetical protein